MHLECFSDPNEMKSMTCGICVFFFVLFFPITLTDSGHLATNLLLIGNWVYLELDVYFNQSYNWSLFHLPAVLAQGIKI